MKVDFIYFRWYFFYVLDEEEKLVKYCDRCDVRNEYNDYCYNLF